MKSIRSTKDSMLAALWELNGYQLIRFLGEDGVPVWATDSSSELNILMKKIDDGKIDINYRALRQACRRVKSMAVENRN